MSEYTQSEPPSPSRSLYISGIPSNVTREDLNELFSGVQGHERIKVPKSTQWDGFIGFAVMLFESVEAATRGIEVLRDRRIGDSKICVDYSRLRAPQEKRAMNADKVKNMKVEEEEQGPSLEELERKEKAAAARARRKAREEEEEEALKRPVATSGPGELAPAKEGGTGARVEPDEEAAARAWRLAEEQAQAHKMGTAQPTAWAQLDAEEQDMKAREFKRFWRRTQEKARGRRMAERAAARRVERRAWGELEAEAQGKEAGEQKAWRQLETQAHGKGAAGARARQRRPGVKEQIMGIAEARDEELAADLSDRAKKQAELEAEVKAIAGGEEVETVESPSDALAAAARDETEARIAAARARRKAREKASEAAEKPDEATRAKEAAETMDELKAEPAKEATDEGTKGWS